MTHHAIEHDVDQMDLVDESSDYDDLNDDDLDVVAHDLDIDNIATPPSPQKVKLYMADRELWAGGGIIHDWV